MTSALSDDILRRARMWSIYSSLYSSLPPEIASSLNKYVRLVRLRRFSAAEDCFKDSCLIINQQCALVRIERAFALFAQGQCGAVRDFVRVGEGFPDTAEDQRMLLVLLDRYATIGARGNLFSALCRAREFKAQLTSISWDEFSLYQVSVSKTKEDVLLMI